MSHVKLFMLVSLISFFSGERAFALQWKDCYKENVKITNDVMSPLAKPQHVARYLPFIGDISISTSTTTGSVSTSTTTTVRFISSNGKCGMFARNELRKEFIAGNLYYVKLDSAKGTGEYLTSLAVLSGCEAEGSARPFAEAVRRRFFSVYADENAREISNRIDGLIYSSSILAKLCRPLS